jgi:hypothetical protein
MTSCFEGFLDGFRCFSAGSVVQSLFAYGSSYTSTKATPVVLFFPETVAV